MKQGPFITLSEREKRIEGGREQEKKAAKAADSKAAQWELGRLLPGTLKVRSWSALPIMTHECISSLVQSSR